MRAFIHAQLPKLNLLRLIIQRIGSRYQTVVPPILSAETSETGKTLSSIQVTARPVKVEKRSRDGTPINVPCFASSEGLALFFPPRIMDAKLNTGVDLKQWKRPVVATKRLM